MITRIYRVRIHTELRDEFEPLFQTVALGSVTKFAGCARVVIGGPAKGTPDEYAMITEWTDADALTEFAGEEWSVAHIPPGMEKFVQECWVHHFEHMAE